jgi:hypothetical protein
VSWLISEAPPISSLFSDEPPILREPNAAIGAIGADDEDDEEECEL